MPSRPARTFPICQAGDIRPSLRGLGASSPRKWARVLANLLLDVEMPRDSFVKPARGLFPLKAVREDKCRPPVGRVDNACGDRHPVCACPPLEDHREAAE